MPFRSPKMYSFIFGFQRRTWWPKCTPASNNSFIVTVTKQLSPLCQLVFGTRRDRGFHLESNQSKSRQWIFDFEFRNANCESEKQKFLEFEIRNPKFAILVIASRTGIV